MKTRPIVFFGTEEFSLATLTALIADGWNVALVVTKPDAPKGRGHKVTEPQVKTLAREHDIPVLQPLKLRDITADVQQLKAPVGVLVSYGKIIPQPIIDLFTPGIINVHPSLLPLYRGPSPMESAIINGDTETGISIMQLSAAMDAGPVYRQITLPLQGTETQPSLYADYAQKGAALLTRTLPTILDGSLLPTPQKDSYASYCQLLTKNDATLDPATTTAAQAERKIRAHLVYPKTKLTLYSQQVIITKAHVEPTKNAPLGITCQDGAFLAIDELIAPSGKRMDAASFLRGYAAAA